MLLSSGDPSKAVSTIENGPSRIEEEKDKDEEEEEEEEEEGRTMLDSNWSADLKSMGLALRVTVRWHKAMPAIGK